MRGTVTAAVRAARSAPLFTLDEIAAAAGLSRRTGRRSVANLSSRGRCTELASAALADTSSRWQRRRRAATWRLCPPPARRAAAADRSQNVRSALAGTAGWTARTLGQPGATRRAFCDRSAALTHPNLLIAGACPPQLLRCFAGHSDWEVRAAAAAATCPPDALVRLAADRDEDVRAFVASNPACPTGVLERLARDLNMTVRTAVAAHPSCPPDALAGFAAVEQYYGQLRTAAAANPSCPPDALGRLAGSVYANDRSLVAANTNCPPETLLELSRDPDPDVSSTAREALTAQQRQHHDEDMPARTEP